MINRYIKQPLNLLACHPAMGISLSTCENTHRLGIWIWLTLQGCINLLCVEVNNKSVSTCYLHRHCWLNLGISIRFGQVVGAYLLPRTSARCLDVRYPTNTVLLSRIPVFIAIASTYRWPRDKMLVLNKHNWNTEVVSYQGQW